MVKNKNNIWIIVLILALVLVFFGGYGMMGFSGGMFSGYYGFEWIFGIVALACAIWVIYDVLASNRGLSDGMKVFWIIFAVIFSIVTAIIYFLVGRNPDNDLFKNRRNSR